MKFDIITIFPHIFDSYISESILRRAQEKKLITIKTHNLRDYTLDRHLKVDDKPYGGGVGLLFKIEPIYKALKAILKSSTLAKGGVRGGNLSNFHTLIILPFYRIVKIL